MDSAPKSAVAKLRNIGIWSQELRHHPDTEATVEAASELEALGYSALFIPDVGGDVFGAAQRLLAATSETIIATGILNIWMHEVDTVVAGYLDLNQRYHDRFALGLGASHAAVINADGSDRYARPYSKMRDFLDEIDAADPTIPPMNRMLAALGPRMMELSRDRSGGAHPYLSPLSHTEQAREFLGSDRILAVELPYILEADLELARDAAREHLELYLGLPNYVTHFRRCGFSDSDFVDGGSRRLIDALIAYGSPDAIAERINAYLKAGADHVCVQAVGHAGTELPLSAWRELASAL